MKSFCTVVYLYVIEINILMLMLENVRKNVILNIISNLIAQTYELRNEYYILFFIYICYPKIFFIIL